MHEVPVVIVRGLIAFFSLLIFTRVLGKQEVGQLTFFDYVNGITIGSIAASLTTNLNSRALTEWVGLATWAGAVLILQLISIKSPLFAKYLNGEPVVVIMNGQIMEETMKKIQYSLSDLTEQLRDKGVFDISEVEFAVLETSGKLSVLKKSSYQPVTPKDLNIPTEYKGLSTELIYDGVIIEKNLRQVKLDRQWLEQQLRNRGINDPAEVMLAALNTQGELYIDKYRDHVANPVDLTEYFDPNPKEGGA